LQKCVVGDGIEAQRLAGGQDGDRVLEAQVSDLALGQREQLGNLGKR